MDARSMAHFPLLLFFVTVFVIVVFVIPVVLVLLVFVLVLVLTVDGRDRDPELITVRIGQEELTRTVRGARDLRYREPGLRQARVQSGQIVGTDINTPALTDRRIERDLLIPAQ